jgi:hypothetical protein
MTDHTPLMALLQAHVQPHARLRKQRLRLLAYLLQALIKLSTVNLAKLALDLPAKPSSNYRRIQRFFAETKLPQQACAALVKHLLPATGRLVVSVDRTEWHFGTTPVNIFMASVVHDGTAFPLVWVMLSKAGSTSGVEQRGLLRKLFCVVPPERVAVVLADREFIGRAFMSYLTSRGVGYAVRIRKDARVGFRGQGKRAKTRRAEDLFQDLKVGQMRRLRARRTVYGQKVWIYGLRLPDGPRGERRLLMVAGTVRRLLKVYRLRWGIEVLFGGLKSRGFDFETTHLRHEERISTLVGLLALAYSLAHATGRYVSWHRPIRIKSHGRRARSVFRVGLDHLRRVLLRGHGQAWRDLLALLTKGAIGPALVPT